MKKYLVTAATVLSVGLIAGCGSNGTSSSSTPTTSITGKVADGYLVNATVFMDKNGNYQLDPGEPFAMTDANGAYTLKVDPADMGKYPIVALATKGVTMDSDNPNSTVASSYVLSMPKDSVSGTVNSNFISPMSSELRELMETGKYTTVDQAMTDMRTQLGIKDTSMNLLQDYMAQNNVGLHTAAQNIAAVMGGQMTQVMGSGGSTTTVQVNRYRGMMGTIFSNMSSIRSANPNMANATILSTMNTVMGSIATPAAGQPYQNMSAAFRAGITKARTGMMGGK